MSRLSEEQRVVAEKLCALVALHYKDGIASYIRTAEDGNGL